MLLPILMLLAQPAAPAAQGLDVYGEWVIPPEEEGGPSRGHVTIERAGPGGESAEGTPVGRITKVGEQLIEAEGDEARDALGTLIVWGFERDEDDGQWEDGKIRDPEAGRTYDAKMRREGDTLSVEGCVLFICREQVWLPAGGAAGVAPAP